MSSFETIPPAEGCAELIDLVGRLGQPRVLVLGDVMLDRYVWGDAERISQEAPVILLRADRREERLGGASSVATLLRALGAKVDLAGVAGHDESGRRVRELLDDMGVDHQAVVPDATRPTTVKERYIGRAQHRHPQQMIRVDYEVRTPVEGELERALLAEVFDRLGRADVVLVSDYDKGVCTPRVLTAVLTACRQRGIRVLADPIRGGDYRKYHGCAALTPNRLEAGLATGRSIQTTADAMASGCQLVDQLDLEAAIVTLDKEGMALVHRDGRRQLFPTRPRQVYDITGAGDMVLAVMGMALAAGVDYGDAIRLANVAGGLEVEKIGVATVTRDEIVHDLQTFAKSAGGPSKLLTRAALASHVERLRQQGRKVAFTNGCFDVLHAGHVEYLQDARAQGDALIVGLNTDASVRRLKGPSRPVNTQEARALVLAGLESIDAITLFDEETPLELIRLVRPDVLVKGADYRVDQVVGAEFVHSYGGRVHLAPLRAGYSTTQLLTRLAAA